MNRLSARSRSARGCRWAAARPPNPGAGFSLIEVALGILLLGIVFLPLFMLFRQGAAGTIQTRDEVAAYGLAADVLHVARGLPFDDPLLAPGQRDVPVLAPLGGSAPDPRFGRSLTVTEGQATGDRVPYRYKVLVARVAWESGGVTRAIRLTGLVFRGKP